MWLDERLNLLLRVGVYACVPSLNFASIKFIWMKMEVLSQLLKYFALEPVYGHGGNWVIL